MPPGFMSASCAPRSAAASSWASAIRLPIVDSPPRFSPEGWVARPYAHRSWWVPVFSEGSPGDWAAWMATRRTFSPTGSTNAVLLTKAGLPGT